MYAQKGHPSRFNLSHERFWQPNEFLLPYPFCLCRLQRHAQIPQHSNPVLLSPHVYLGKESHRAQKSFEPLDLLKASAKVGIPASSAGQGVLPPGPHCVGSPTMGNALGSSRGVFIPERAKHTRHPWPTPLTWGTLPTLNPTCSACCLGKWQNRHQFPLAQYLSAVFPGWLHQDLSVPLCS